MRDWEPEQEFQSRRALWLFRIEASIVVFFMVVGTAGLIWRYLL